MWLAKIQKKGPVFLRASSAFVSGAPKPHFLAPAEFAGVVPGLADNVPGSLGDHTGTIPSGAPADERWSISERLSMRIHSASECGLRQLAGYKANFAALGKGGRNCILNSYITLPVFPRAFARVDCPPVQMLASVMEKRFWS